MKHDAGGYAVAVGCESVEGAICRWAGALVAAAAILALLPGPARADSLQRVTAGRAAARVHGGTGVDRRKRRAPVHRPSHPRTVASPPGTYTNPIAGPSPDPAGLDNNAANSDYYLYSSGDGFPIERSRDLVHWTPAGFAFAHRPDWVVQTGDWHPWGPSVIQEPGLCPLNTVLPALSRHQHVSTTCYFLYYTGESAQFNTNCVAVATAVAPLGPFVDQGPLSNGTADAHGRPIGCGDNAGYGNIDPDPFLDTDGQQYLYVSTDIACPAPTTCMLQPTISVMVLGPDHIGVVGSRVALFAGTAPWEQVRTTHMTVEGPWMDKHDGVYHLFFSGGDWHRAYGEGDATLATPLGPAVQDPANPILTDTAKVFSPGGGSTITGPHGGDWMLYHAKLGGYNQPRQLFIDPVVWGANGTVTIAGPTTTPQSTVP